MPQSPPSDRPIRIAVVGAGAIGGTFGARLSSVDGVHVTMCVRRPVDRLELESAGVRATADVEITTSVDSVGQVDWLLVATKAYSVPSATDWFRRLGRPSIATAVLQNGIDHEARLRPYVEGPIVPVIVRVAAELVAPGSVRQTGAGSVSVPDTDEGTAFAALCSAAGIDASVDRDFATSLWTKFAYNLTGNTLTTIIDQPVNRIPRHAGLRWLVHAIVEECTSVGAEHGARLDDRLAENALELFGSYPDETMSSMHQDRRRGRPLERDALTGALVRLAAAQGQSVPATTSVDALLEAIERADCDASPPLTEEN